MAQIVDEEPQNLISQVLLRINASNLPRYGILQSLPDVYAVVSSVTVPNGQGVPFDLAHTDNGDGSNSHGQKKMEWGRTEMYVLFDTTYSELPWWY